MATEFHQRVRQIFDQALERPEAERPKFVEVASAGDAALLDTVNRLLRARNEADSFLETMPGHTQQIGRYLINGELGRGAMGVVYDAVDPMIGRRVAVKVISLKAETDPAAAEFMKERLFREARSAGRLFHPGIVIILDVGLHEDSAFITMERVDGESLQQLLASSGALTPAAALGILQQTAAALDYAHRQGVIHRDIKPANIMIENKVTVKVADFGIAKLMSAQNQTLTGVLMGTPSYMSPEQVEGRPVDGRSDQFSLAVLAYELLTGARPFVADSMPTVAHLIVYGPRPSVLATNPSLPPEVDQVLDRALNRFPEQRFASCTEFAAALETALLHLHAVGSSAPVKVTKRAAIPVAYLGVVAALVIVALVLASVYYRNFYSRPLPAPPSKAAVVVQTPPTPPPVPVTVPPQPASAPAASAPQPDSTPKPVPTAVRAQQLYSTAMAKRREGKPQDAVALFRQAAALGDANAMDELAESYSNGDGVTRNEMEAAEWFSLAAKAGNSAAMLSLGGLYLLGSDAVPQSDEDAAKWFQKAADMKNPAGMYDLATLYENGQGVPRNMDKARQLYRDSAALGNHEAQRRLAELEPKK